MPVDDSVSEFLLVDAAAPWLHAPCQEGPKVNSMVRVVLRNRDDVPRPGSLTECVGTLAIAANVFEGQCLDVYSLEADSVLVVK